MQSNMTILLSALLAGEVPNITPKSRFEEYLLAACERCGCQNVPQPTSRADALLYELAEMHGEMKKYNGEHEVIA